MPMLKFLTHQVGVQVSFKKSLSDKIRNVVRDDPGIASQVIEVKFSGDGTLPTEIFKKFVK